MPNITVQWYAGRTDQQKREIVAAITDAMVKIGRPPPTRSTWCSRTWRRPTGG